MTILIESSPFHCNCCLQVDLYKQPNYALVPFYVCIPYTAIGLPKTGIIFTVQNSNSCLFYLFSKIK